MREKLQEPLGSTKSSKTRKYVKSKRAQLQQRLITASVILILCCLSIGMLPLYYAIRKNSSFNTVEGRQKVLEEANRWINQTGKIKASIISQQFQMNVNELELQVETIETLS